MAPAIVQEIVVNPIMSPARRAVDVHVDDLGAVVDDEEQQQQQERQFLLSYDDNSNPFQSYDSIQKLKQQQQQQQQQPYYSQLHCWIFNKSSSSNDSIGESLTVGLTSDDEEKNFSDDEYDENSKSHDDDDNNRTSGNDLPSNPLVKAYCDALQRNPLWVKSWTAFVLLGCADALAQCIEHSRGIYKYCHSTPSSLVSTSSSSSSVSSWSITFCFDICRMLRFATFGLVGTPWAHYYYAWLDTTLPPTSNPWTLTTFIKVCIDQFVQAPILLALIIIGMGLMQFESIHDIKHDLKLQYLSTLIANWKLWIPAMVLNIAFVKPIFRVLYDNVVFFVWTIFLSMMLNADDGGA